MRRALEQWFDGQAIIPKVVAECDDSALGKDFGEDGMGVFAAPSVIEKEILVVANCEAARQSIFPKQ